MSLKYPLEDEKRSRHMGKEIVLVMSENKWEETRDLGSMEGNQAQLLAERMKGKGRSWSPSGAYHMAKVQELLANGEVRPWCFRQMRHSKPRTRFTRHHRSQPNAPDQWMQAAVPALYGPSANAPWVQWLRQLVHPKRLLI